MINRQVAANAPARMAADSGYTSDSIESYKEAAGTIQAYNGMNDAQLTDMTDTLVAADSMQPKKSSVTDSDERSSSRRNIRGNLSLNESLSREKQSHDRPRFSPIQSAKREFNAGRNLGKRKNDRKKVFKK